MQDELLSIQEVSDRLKVPKHTLRFWEKELDGIMVPLRTNGGQRRYSLETISIIEEVKRLRGGGLSLTEIRRRLGNSNSNKSTIDLLAERVAEVVKSEVYRFLESEALANHHEKHDGNERESNQQTSNHEVTPRIAPLSTGQAKVAKSEDQSGKSPSGEHHMSETTMKTSYEET